MAEREEIVYVEVSYRDGDTIRWHPEDGWIRVREEQVSLEDKRTKRSYEIHWTEVE